MKKATNAGVMKEKNKKLMLSLIREKPVFRAQLSAMTGLTKPAISIIIDDLLQQGIVLETPSAVSGAGRRPLLLTLNRDAYFAIGINIARSNFTIGIMNVCGEVIAEQTEDILGMDPHTVLEKIGEICSLQLRSCGMDPAKIGGIGVTTPGPVDTDKGIILNPPNFSQWHHLNISHKLEALTGYPVFLQNISNGWALYEKYFGTAKDASHFMTIIADEGVGSGIIIDNQIYAGINELGHTSIKFDGIACECGNIGCLEKYASLPALLSNTGFSSWKSVIDSGNTALIKQEAKYLGIAIINAANLFDLELIVLAGDIRYRPHQLILYLEKEIASKTLSGKNISVRGTALQSKVLCAGTLSLYHFFN